MLVEIAGFLSLLVFGYAMYLLCGGLKGRDREKCLLILALGWNLVATLLWWAV